MTTNPIDTAFPATGVGLRGDVADLFKERMIVRCTSVTEFQGFDLTGYKSVIIGTNQSRYEYSATSTDADNGTSVLVDTAGNRFLVVSADDFTAADMGALISGATAKTTPVDADTIGISDSAASAVLKKLTFANLWTWVKSKLSGTDPIVVGGLLYTTGYQWVTGSLSGTTVPAPAANIQVSVIWDTAGTSASMTLTLPASPANGQVMEFAYINAITSLAFTGGSILGYGGASAVPGGGNTKLVFNTAFGVWARLGD